MRKRMKGITPQFLLNEANFLESSQSETQYCMFCSGMDLLHCVQMSVMNKHNEIENFEEKLINNIIRGDSSSAVKKKFKDVIDEIANQRLTRYYKRNENQGQMNNLLDFYKFRKFVPRFAPNRQSFIAQSYYYQRLKLYYNEIKRQLNITVDPSSQFTSFQTSGSITLSKNIEQTIILQKLQDTIKFQESTGPTLNNYITQSKALQDLLNFLKANPKMDHIPEFKIQSLSKQIKKSSKEIFKDFLQKNKTINQITTHNKNKIFITFYSKSNSISQLKNNNHLKPLKSQNFTKIKQPIKNVQIFSKLQKIKNEILNQKVKQIIKLKTKHQDRNTPIKLKTLKKEVDNSKQHRCIEKNSLQNLAQGKKLPFKSQLKPVSKFKSKRSQSEAKMKSTKSSLDNKNLRSISSKTIKKFLNGQKIELKKQGLKKQTVCKNLKSQRPLSRRKTLNLKELKIFIKESQNQKLQKIDKKEDYLTQRFQNLEFETPKRIPKTTNVTPINSVRQKNQIIMQKNDNIISMKKKKLQMLKKNLLHQMTQRKQ